MVNAENKGILTYIHIFIGLFLMFIAGHIVSPIYPLTEVGMQIMGVFLGVVWLWCFVGFLWPSLLALVAFGLTDFAGFGQVLTMSFGSAVPVLLLFSMILFGSPQHVGATAYITRWFLTRKVFNGKPVVFAFVFFFATYVLSVAVNVTPALILMWTVLYGVLKDLNYKKGDKFTSLMLVGTFLGAISGQASLPFSGSTLAILSVFETSMVMVTGMATVMPIPQYLFLGFIFSVLVFLAYCGFMKLALKPAEVANVAKVNADMFNLDPLPPMNKLQKFNFYGMLSFIILMLLPSFLPDEFIVTEILDGLGPTGVAILLTGIMCLLRIEGTPILDFTAVAKKSINWDIFVMVATAMAIASALTNEATGVVNGMLVFFEPILGGHSAIGFYIIMLLLGMVVTSFASSMVIGIATMPILVAFGMAAGANVIAVAATTTLLIHYSIILPSASVFAAMLWCNEDWITPKEVFKYGALIVVIAVVIAIVAIMPISNLIF
jgi:sodium-dependent dicarboxylate transporter 2/3/5